MFEVRNIMEELVEERLDDSIAKGGGCSCECCRADIKAYALNKLPSKYVSRPKGGLITKVEAMRIQAAADVIVAVMAAVNVVKVNPRHDIEK